MLEENDLLMMFGKARRTHVAYVQARVRRVQLVHQSLCVYRDGRDAPAVRVVLHEPCFTSAINRATLTPPPAMVNVHSTNALRRCINARTSTMPHFQPSC